MGVSHGSVKMEAVGSCVTSVAVLFACKAIVLSVLSIFADSLEALADDLAVARATL